MIISIFASIGAQNIGDELILKNEIDILEQRYSKELKEKNETLQFRVFSYDLSSVFFTKDNVTYYEYFPIGIKKISNIWRNIKNFIVFIISVIKSDLIVFGGGGIIYDNEMQSVGSPLKQWLFRVSVFKFFRKRVEFFRGGIHIKEEKNMSIIKKIFTKVDMISVRDNYSLELLSSLGIKKNISRQDDPVFSDRQNSYQHIKNTSEVRGLQSRALTKESIIDLVDINDIQKKTVGISLRRMNIQNYKQNIKEILCWIVDNGGSILFIPHSFHKTDKLANDYIFLQEMYCFIKEKYTEKIIQKKLKVNICTTMNESYEVYLQKRVDINLAQRLHSIILSYVYNINFIGISYSKKTDEILEQMIQKNNK